MKTILISLIVSVTLSACTSSAPKFDLENAKNEIEAANRELSDFMAKGDSVGLASAYSAEGALMLNNMPSVKGKENLIRLCKGKYIVLWKKENGKWKLHRDISNSDLPAVSH
jgi:ketosteroid isomerase-like protein